MTDTTPMQPNRKRETDRGGQRTRQTERSMTVRLTVNNTGLQTVTARGRDIDR